MSGLQNKRNSGEYLGLHWVLTPGGPVCAAAIGWQMLQVGGGSTFFECSHMDHLGTPYAITGSIPPGAAIHGMTCGPGNGVLQCSKTLMIDGHASEQSHSLNTLYGLNCPLAQMVKVSDSDMLMRVGG